jgi:hypothetical protein
MQLDEFHCSTKCLFGEVSEQKDDSTWFVLRNNKSMSCKNANKYCLNKNVFLSCGEMHEPDSPNHLIMVLLMAASDPRLFEIKKTAIF